MNTLHVLARSAVPLLAANAAWAQNDNMMSGAWGGGWMGGYVGMLMPVLLIAVVVGVVVMIVRRK